jgi:glycosyl transferase family 2
VDAATWSAANHHGFFVILNVAVGGAFPAALAHTQRPDPPEVYAWRRRLTTGSLAPTVDVFITVYGEPIEIVLVTVRAARDRRVAHQTWVLDDSNSDALHDACFAEGAGYLRRTEHVYAKAGNINAGLRRTDGEFVVILDADHVPSPDFLLRALPHMQDEEVAFVPTRRRSRAGQLRDGRRRRSAAHRREALRGIIMSRPSGAGAPPSVAPTPAPHRPVPKSPNRWWARLIVLVMVAVAAPVFVRLTAIRTTNASLIDLGTVTLTTQSIPVETPRPGQVTEVSVRARTGGHGRPGPIGPWPG